MPTTKRLRISPTFVLAFTLDGRPYIAKDTEPYIQYWLTDRYRILLSLFSTRQGITVEEAIDSYFRLTCKNDTQSERKLLAKAVKDMCDAEVLVDPRDDTSRYSAKIVEDYTAHRPFPSELVEHIIHSGQINSTSRILDLAGGPGDLALMLAKTSNDVTLMDLSKGFLNAANKRAKKSGLKLTTVHESCNRLVYQDDEYDVITISQALHWLDDVMVCRGVCRLLRTDGSFFVIHSVMDVDDQHPLAYILGNNSILGKKIPQSFVAEVQPLLKRLTLLFDALDAPEVQRIDPTQQWQNQQGGMIQKIVPVGISIYRQHRPFDLGFVRGFLTSKHIEATGQNPDDFWQDLEMRCGRATAEQMLGYHHWAILHFQRGGTCVEQQLLETHKVEEIGFQANVF